MFQLKVVQKIKTHILCSVTFFENRAVYEIMWKNFVEWGTPQMAIWIMLVTRWIPKATNKHSIYVMLIALPCKNSCKNAPQYYVIRTLLPLMTFCFPYIFSGHYVSGFNCGCKFFIFLPAFFSMMQQPPVGQGLLISRLHDHTQTHHSR